MSERLRILRTLALVVTPLIILAVVGLRREVQDGEAQIAQERIALARAVALATQSFVAGNLSTVSTMAVAPAVTDLTNISRVSQFLANAAAANGDWEGIAILDSAGVALVGSSQPSQVNVADRPYFQQVMATRRPVVSSGIIGRASGLPTIVLAVPVSFSSGETAALVVPVPTDRLRSALRSQIGTDTLRVTVVDQEGQTIVHRDPDRMRELASLRDRPDAQAALSGEVGSQVLSIDGTSTLVAYAPVADHGWGVLIAEPTATAFAPIRVGLVQDIVLLGVALAVVGLIGWYFAGRLSLFYNRLIEARREAEAAQADAEGARQQSAFLAEASRDLAGSLDLEATIAATTHLAVPRIADWCVLELFDNQGAMQRVGIAHADPQKAALAQEFARYYPADPSASTAIRTGHPELIAEISDALLIGTARDEEHLRVLKALDLKSGMVIPLIAGGRTLGALTLMAAESGRTYGSADMAMAENLAGRAALALDHARVHRELQLALSTRDEFLASASHDLRNPLTAIKVSAQALDLQLTSGANVAPERVTQTLRSIDAIATRMARLIDGLLDVTRLQFGRPLDLARHPTDLGALVRQVVAECQQTTVRHEIQVEAPPDVVGEWDPARLHRALTNLLDNAVKYSPDGGAVSVVVAREDGRSPSAVITIRDHGLGIPQEELPRMFDRFTRGSNVVGLIPGTGIGLAGARQIVEQHGGTISLESQVGAGTMATVRLPLGIVGVSEQLRGDAAGERAGQKAAERPASDSTNLTSAE